MQLQKIQFATRYDIDLREEDMVYSFMHFEMYSGGSTYVCEVTERNDDTESIIEICTSYLCNCKSLTLRKEDMD